jgi:hypothetical protein
MVAAMDESMSKFKIKVARIETGTGSRADPHVCATFQIKRAEVSFQVPIRLSVSDYDDTEMVQAARSALHRTFAELAAQSRDWSLSATDLRKLSRMSLRPKKQGKTKILHQTARARRED